MSKHTIQKQFKLKLFTNPCCVLNNGHYVEHENVSLFLVGGAAPAEAVNLAGSGLSEQILQYLLFLMPQVK